MAEHENTSRDGFVLSALVANKPGVLVRIATVFARRGFNIDSLTVSPAHRKGMSRMTIASRGGAERIDQIVKQIEKLIDVVHIYTGAEEEMVHREMALFKVSCDIGNRASVLEVANIFRTKTVDISDTSMTFEVTGSSEKLNAFEDMMDAFGIIEMMRTGRLVLKRGAEPT